LFVFGGNGKILDANEGARLMFGLPLEALLEATIDDISLGKSPYSQREADAKIERALAGHSQVFEWRSKRSNGHLFWSEIALRAWDTGGAGRLVAAVRDISERKKIEQQRQDNEERLRMAMVASRQGWFELNVQTGEGRS